jgi:hypothetical protein
MVTEVACMERCKAFKMLQGDISLLRVRKIVRKLISKRIPWRSKGLLLRNDNMEG